MNADTFSINIDFDVPLQWLTVSLHVLKCRIGYKLLMDSDFCQAEQFQAERFLEINKEFTTNGKMYYLQESTRPRSLGTSGIKDNCKSQTVGSGKEKEKNYYESP